MNNFPSFYYYLSRYDSIEERVIHIFKYWIFYFLTTLILSHQPLNWTISLYSLIGWFAFMNLYDFFSYQNDKLAVKESTAANVRKVIIVNERKFYFYKIFYFILFFLPFLLISIKISYELFLFFFILSITFYIHNLLPYYIRFLTFFSLYILKGSLFLVIIYSLNEVKISVYIKEYMIFNFFFALSYLPHYMLRKNFSKFKNINVIKKISKAIFYKILILLTYSLYIDDFVYLTIFTLMITSLEYFIKKRFKA